MRCGSDSAPPEGWPSAAAYRRRQELARSPPAGALPSQECPDICDSCMDDGSCESCAPGAMQVGTPSPSGAVTCVKCKDPLCEE